MPGNLCAFWRRLGWINADSNRAPDPRLPRDESAALKRLHHLIDAWRGNHEVLRDVGFCRRNMISRDVLGNECEVLELALAGLRRAGRRRGRSRAAWRGNECGRIRIDRQCRAVGEMDDQALRFACADVRHLLALQGTGEKVGVENSSCQATSGNEVVMQRG